MQSVHADTKSYHVSYVNTQSTTQFFCTPFLKMEETDTFNVYRDGASRALKHQELIDVLNRHTFMAAKGVMKVYPQMKFRVCEGMCISIKNVIWVLVFNLKILPVTSQPPNPAFPLGRENQSPLCLVVLPSHPRFVVPIPSPLYHPTRIRVDISLISP